MVDDEESPIIRLPGNKEIVDKLKHKLVEYANRASERWDNINKEEYMHPALKRTLIIASSPYCKLAVLTEVLTKGEFKTHDLSRELWKTDKDLFGMDLHLEDPDFYGRYLTNFQKACWIVNDYCTTGGKTVNGGTGLK